MEAVPRTEVKEEENVTKTKKSSQALSKFSVSTNVPSTSRRDHHCATCE